MKKILITFVAVVFGISANAGEPKKSYITAEKINVFDPTQPDIILGSTLIARDCEDEHDELVEKIKKLQYKKSLTEVDRHESETSNKTDLQGFTRGKLFQANTFDGGTPSDNTLALSNSGFFVAAINSVVDFYDSTGKKLATKALSSFASDASLTFTFDPKVIYDPEADRFILVFLNGNTSSTSKVVVAFSTSGDPRSKWNVYKISGNPLKDNSWTDYPNIGVSAKDFYITTNLFVGVGTYSQAIIQQIPKEDGYNGAASLKIKIWEDVMDDQSQSMLGLYPLMGGQSRLYGPGMYFACTSRGGSNYFSIARITGDYSDAGSQIQVKSLTCNAYQVGRDAVMKGNSDDLSIGDCRVKGGFQLRDNLYFVYSGTFGLNIWSNIIYVKYNITSNTFKMANFGTQFESFCYPNISSFAVDEYDETVAINFNTSSNKYNPEARFVVCDQWMQFSKQDTFRRGDTYIDALGAGVTERWGDYSGIARWHNKPYRSVWGYNMVGQILPNSTRRIGNWICEITANAKAGVESTTQESVNIEAYPNPVSSPFIYIDFQLNHSRKIEVQLYDMEGKLIRTLTQQSLNPGKYTFSLQTDDLSGGVYLLKINSDNRSIKTQKIIIP